MLHVTCSDMPLLSEVPFRLRRPQTAVGSPQSIAQQHVSRSTCATANSKRQTATSRPRAPTALPTAHSPQSTAHSPQEAKATAKFQVGQQGQGQGQGQDQDRKTKQQAGARSTCSKSLCFFCPLCARWWWWCVCLCLCVRSALSGSTASDEAAHGTRTAVRLQGGSAAARQLPLPLPPAASRAPQSAAARSSQLKAKSKGSSNLLATPYRRRGQGRFRFL
jgi:hypothetical protein